MRLVFAAKETTVRCLSFDNAMGENSGNCDGFAVKKKCKTNFSYLFILVDSLVNPISALYEH